MQKIKLVLGTFIISCGLTSVAYAGIHPDPECPPSQEVKWYSQELGGGNWWASYKMRMWVGRRNTPSMQNPELSTVVENTPAYNQRTDSCTYEALDKDNNRHTIVLYHQHGLPAQGGEPIKVFITNHGTNDRTK